jgi:hypothetical protein
MQADAISRNCNRVPVRAHLHPGEYRRHPVAVRKRVEAHLPQELPARLPSDDTRNHRKIAHWEEVKRHIEDKS